MNLDKNLKAAESSQITFSSFYSSCFPDDSINPSSTAKSTISCSSFYGSSHLKFLNKLETEKKEKIEKERQISEIIGDENENAVREKVFAVFYNQSDAFDFFNSLKESVQKYSSVFAEEINENGKRRYIACTYREFLQYYTNINISNRHAYEIIREYRPCWMYFDIEFDKNENKEIRGKNAIHVFLKELKLFLYNNYDVYIDEHEDVIELTSSSKSKFSRHILIKTLRCKKCRNKLTITVLSALCTSCNFFLKNEKDIGMKEDRVKKKKKLNEVVIKENLERNKKEETDLSNLEEDKKDMKDIFFLKNCNKDATVILDNQDINKEEKEKKIDLIIEKDKVEIYKEENYALNKEDNEAECISFDKINENFNFITNNCIKLESSDIANKFTMTTSDKNNNYNNSNAAHVNNHNYCTRKNTINKNENEIYSTIFGNNFELKEFVESFIFFLMQKIYKTYLETFSFDFNKFLEEFDLTKKDADLFYNNCVQEEDKSKIEKDKKMKLSVEKYVQSKQEENKAEEVLQMKKLLFPFKIEKKNNLEKNVRKRKCIIDTTVYSRNRCFRIMFSSKFSKQEFFKLCKNRAVENKFEKFDEVCILNSLASKIHPSLLSSKFMLNNSNEFVGNMNEPGKNRNYSKPIKPNNMNLYLKDREIVWKVRNTEEEKDIAKSQKSCYCIQKKDVSLFETKSACLYATLYVLFSWDLKLLFKQKQNKRRNVSLFSFPHFSHFSYILDDLFCDLCLALEFECVCENDIRDILEVKEKLKQLWEINIFDDERKEEEEEEYTENLEEIKELKEKKKKSEKNATLDNKYDGFFVENKICKLFNFFLFKKKKILYEDLKKVNKQLIQVFLSKCMSILFFPATNRIVFSPKLNKYCCNIQRPHKSNSIILIIDLQSKTFYQKCHDLADCSSFHSTFFFFPPLISLFLNHEFEQFQILNEIAVMDISAFSSNSLILSSSSSFLFSQNVSACSSFATDSSKLNFGKLNNLYNAKDAEENKLYEVKKKNEIQNEIETKEAQRELKDNKCENNIEEKSNLKTTYNHTQKIREKDEKFQNLESNAPNCLDDLEWINLLPLD